LHRSAAHIEDVHVVVEPKPGKRTPTPMFATPRAGSHETFVLLVENGFFNNDNTSGWIDEPGRPLMFWLRRSDREIAVLMIDTPAVEAAINRWLEKWATPVFAPVHVAGGPDQFRARDERVLATTGDAMS